MNLDGRKTELQETGYCPSTGMTLAEAIEVVVDLGLDPNEIIFTWGGKLHIRKGVK